MVVGAEIRQDEGEEVTVHPSVTAALPEIAALCERLGVSRLGLFGSATGPEFDEQTSDIDVVVEFGPSALTYFDAYFALKRACRRFSAVRSTSWSPQASEIPTS